MATVSAALLAAAGGAHAQACPPLEQPALSQVLSKLIRDARADDAMQCVILSVSAAREAGETLSDEVRYQLAKQASDAIEGLGGDALVMSSYHAEATRLWQEYLDGASDPLDRGRLTFGITKIMQHGRFGAFNELFTVLAKAMVKGRSWVTTAQSDQLFATVKRCPAWSNSSKSGPISCTNPCPTIGRTLLADLSAQFDAVSWNGSDGVKRLATNAKALESSLACVPR